MEVVKPVIQVEISGYCNLECRMCYYPRMQRTKGFMSTDTFTKIIQGAKKLGVDCLRLFVFGDPLLHPKLDTFLSLLKENNIKADITTNGVKLTPGIIESIIKNKVFRVVISIDGCDQSTYSKIRTGGNYQRVVHNTLTLKNEILRAKASTRIQVQTMLMDLTESTINKTVNFWRSQRVPISIQLVQTQAGTVPDYSAKRIPHNIPVKVPVLCSAPFNKLIVYWEGGVGFCCSDGEGKTIVEHLDNKPLEQIWTCNDFTLARTLFEQGELNFCKKCTLYKHYGQ